MMPADIQIMGAAQEYVTVLGAVSTPTEIACAEKVKAPTYLAAGSTLGMVGTGLFGVYKIFKGRPAAGVTALVGSGLLYIVGATFAKAATLQFEN